MYKWYLPTLSEIIALDMPFPEPADCGFQSPAQQHLRAEREWSGAIAALKQLLQSVLLTEAKQAEAKQAEAKQAKANNSAENFSREKFSSPHNSFPSPSIEGLLLSGPFPVLDQSELLARLATWTLTVGRAGEMPMQLLPAADAVGAVTNMPIPTLPLLSTDPLAAEQFCLALTAKFSVVLVLGETPTGDPAFLFSFDPEVVQQAWRSLQARLKMTAPYALTALNLLVEQFQFVTPDYRLVTQFSHLMLANLPHPSDLEEKRVIQTGYAFQGIADSLTAPAPAVAESQPSRVSQSPERAQPATRFSAQACSARKVPEKVKASIEPPADQRANSRFDTELLQAIAHEVRTPLTTIRTLTRLLLRRKDMNPDVMKRLEIIDRECTEQIDRFSLIFRAAELEMANGKSSLTALAPISLSQVLQQNVARWQQQANQHSHSLEVILPQKLPMVVTDPVMLDQMLTGLVDRITHTLPPGSHIQIQVSQAGHQLKLQLESQPQHVEDKHKFGFAPALKSLGQLLMFQPETGSLSLNMAVTKSLFQAVGGKLIVKQRPQQGEVLTIFLPLANR